MQTIKLLCHLYTVPVDTSRGETVRLRNASAARFGQSGPVHPENMALFSSPRRPVLQEPICPFSAGAIGGRERLGSRTSPGDGEFLSGTDAALSGFRAPSFGPRYEHGIRRLSSPHVVKLRVSQAHLLTSVSLIKTEKTELPSITPASA